MTRNHDINERAPYYTRMAVSPTDPDEIYFLNVKFIVSKDGGKTIKGSFSQKKSKEIIWRKLQELKNQEIDQSDFSKVNFNYK